MIFEISRASVWNREEQPTKKAVFDKKKKQWIIGINSLEDLMELIKEEGQLVVDETDIIIYDGYIE